MRFGGLVAVNDLSFSVSAGEIRGLIGPNGAGKTTIFNVVSGFYRPHSGRVLYGGEDIAGLGMNRIAERGLARTFQHAALFDELTVLENVLVGCHLLEKPGVFSSLVKGGARKKEIEKRAGEVLDFFGLHSRREERGGDLPHGLQRALGVAIAMAAKPKVLLLDEPFAGMNPGETRGLMQLVRKIREAGATVLLVEHDMRAVMELCDRITVVNFGRLLFEGAPGEVQRHPEVVRAYLGEAGDAV